MFNVDQLHVLRDAELNLLLQDIPADSLILEFGAGTGRQAKALASMGYNVDAIDLADSNYAVDRVYSVRDYDGIHIPLPDHSVDVIFSSNVLEHVEDLETIFGEFKRVTRPAGFGIHLMPTPSWRFWTFVTGAINSLLILVQLPKNFVSPPNGQSRSYTLMRNIRSIVGGLLPRGHGTSFEGLSEFWTFSERRWRKTFKKNGFFVDHVRPTGLFYTGMMLFGRRLSVAQREGLSKLLGSACNVYLIRPISAENREHHESLSLAQKGSLSELRPQSHRHPAGRP